MRLGIHYTHFNQFDGASSNYNFGLRDASDNNTLTAYWVWAF
jgi:hypothetical protein